MMLYRPVYSGEPGITQEFRQLSAVVEQLVFGVNQVKAGAGGGQLDGGTPFTVFAPSDPSVDCGGP
jgi:hypothetical protein